MKTTQFSDLPLGPEIQKALRENEHHTPTPIQAAAIPVVLEGRDLLGCAQTGTGKTAAFALPMLQQMHREKLRPAPKAPLALVLVPTRELAAQVADSFRKYGQHLRIWQTAIFGGVGQHPQVTALRRGVHVLIATPGRLIDLLQQGHVRLDQVRTLVLDEADRMLDMGFLPPLKKIIAELPEQRQSLCFSATMPHEIADLVQSLLKNPHRIDIAPPSSTNRQVEQIVIQVSQTDKRDQLQQLLKGEGAHRVLVFTRTKRRADIVAKQLQQADIEADAIHGDKSQNARTRALDRFKRGRTHVLVATDVAARGIDVDGISHVVNYDLPHDAESYVHRIGRTGRASAVGKAITFYDASERRQIRLIEKLTGQQLLPPGEARYADESSSEDRGPRRYQGQRTGQRPSGRPPQGARRFENKRPQSHSAPPRMARSSFAQSEQSEDAGSEKRPRPQAAQGQEQQAESRQSQSQRSESRQGQRAEGQHAAGEQREGRSRGEQYRGARRPAEGSRAAGAQQGRRPARPQQERRTEGASEEGRQEGGAAAYQKRGRTNKTGRPANGRPQKKKFKSKYVAEKGPLSGRMEFITKESLAAQDQDGRQQEAGAPPAPRYKRRRKPAASRS